jgi:hypothetical protein
VQQPCLYDTLHTAEPAGIELKEILLVGVVGNSFDVGTELGRYVSPFMGEVLKRLVEFIRRHGVKVERRAIALAMRPWWESENPAAS